MVGAKAVADALDTFSPDLPSETVYRWFAVVANVAVNTVHVPEVGDSTMEPLAPLVMPAVACPEPELAEQVPAPVEPVGSCKNAKLGFAVTVSAKLPGY